MEVKDVIHILEDISVDNTNTDTFNNLYKAYRESGTDSDVYALRLWDHMEKNQYLPEHLESEDDIAIAETLVNIAMEDDDILAYKYAVLLMYHRFILSDILEKAYVARELISFFVICPDIAMNILQEFISNALDDIIYRDAFDDEDKDISIMYSEMIRAILPFVEWLHEEYQDGQGYDIHGVDDSEVLELIKMTNTIHDKKPAQQKLSAFCRYLYENIHS